jgi:hypothetical protein
MYSLGSVDHGLLISSLNTIDQILTQVAMMVPQKCNY